MSGTEQEQQPVVEAPVPAPAPQEELPKSDETIKEPPSDEISQELKAHVHTIRAMATAHNLLAEGVFGYQNFQKVHESMLFLKGIFDRAVELAAQDPQADLVPELKEYKENVAKKKEMLKGLTEAANGQA